MLSTMKKRKKATAEGRSDVLGLVDAQVDVNRANLGLLDRITELDTDEACQRNSLADLASFFCPENSPNVGADCWCFG